MDLDYHQIFEDSPINLLILDSEGTVTHANPSAMKLFGYDHSNLISQPFFKLQPHPLSQRRTSYSALSILADAKKPVETVLQRKDGGQFPGLISCKKSLFRDNDISGNERKEVHYIIHVENSTQLKMQESAHILDKSIAEQANKSKSEFLSMMSHEIRTPIQGTIGSLDVLDLIIHDPHQRRFLELARNSADTLLRIVDDILDIACIEASALKLQPRPFDLRPLIDDLVAIYNPQVAKLGNTISVVIDNNLPESIVADEGRVRQIFSNYISNANKFTDHGQIEIELKSLDQGEILFQVTDSGYGIDDSVKDIIFTQFGRGYQGNLKHKSTGLGLSICKKLATLMNGTVGFSSNRSSNTPSDGSSNNSDTKRSGTCFWFRFSPETPESRTSKANRLEATPSKGFNNSIAAPKVEAKICGTNINKHILLVEDSEINRELFSAILSEYKFIIQTAENGEKAIIEYKNNRPDIIIMDLQMPIMNGYDATQAIRKLESLSNEKNPRLPILAMTADVIGNVKERCRESGLDDYIPKPIIKEDLLVKINEWLDIATISTTDITPTTTPTPTPTEKQVSVESSELDHQFLDRQFSQVRPESIQRMISIYIEETRRRLTTIQGALEQENFDQLSRESHILKSSSGSFGATTLSNIALELENGAIENLSNICREKVSALNETFNRTEEQLIKYSTKP